MTVRMLRLVLVLGLILASGCSGAGSGYLTAGSVDVPQDAPVAVNPAGSAQDEPEPTPQPGEIQVPVGSDFNIDPSQLEPAQPAVQPASPQTPFPTRPLYAPGELVDYIAQTGDYLPALAARFNTTVSEIRAANPIIPKDVTTLPPGLPMEIPIYYLPFWGNPFQILPDSLFINGPAQAQFDTAAYIASQPGWLNGYSGYVSGYSRTAAQIVDLVALNYSVSPQLLLALLEYHAAALSAPAASEEATRFPFGVIDARHESLYMQLGWVANLLNNGYYGWRSGELTVMELLNGRIERPDPAQNAATVALQYYFSRRLTPEDYSAAISEAGFAATYASLFGDPWQGEQPHLPGSLTQPALRLPFEPRAIWAYTGGPHTGWGAGAPLSALDFAPPSVVGGCQGTDEWATAVADGIIARSAPAIVVLDLDGDGDERTGWVVFYLHVATEGRIPAGTQVKAGDPIGRPSCEGGRATGTHIHIARKYNGEWMLADGPLAFNLEGWIAHNGSAEYLGTLTRYSQTVTACVCSDHWSHIESKGGQ